MERSTLHSRLETAAGNRTYRHLAELTATHPESVRRYMQGHAPSVEFLSGLCSTLGISAAWLLTGQGPMLAAEVREHVLKSSTPADLFGAMAEQLESMRSRLERVEVHVLALEARERAAALTPGFDTDTAAEDMFGPMADSDLEAKPRRDAGGDPVTTLADDQSPAQPPRGDGTGHDGQPLPTGG